MSPPPLRVLYVHHRSEGGGAPKSLALLIEALGEAVEATVVCPPGRAAEQFERSGARVVEAPAAAFTHIWASTYRGARWALLAAEIGRLRPHLRAVRSAIAAFRPDVVHLNEAPLAPAAWAASRAGIPVVWHLRSALPDRGRARSRAVRRAVERLADVAIAINRDVAASYGLDPPAEVVFNPVPLPPASPDPDPAAKRALGLEPDLPAVGMLSNLYATKGYPDLIEAVARLARAGRPVQAVLAGDPVRPPAWFRTVRGRALRHARLVEDTEASLDELIRRLDVGSLVHAVPFRSDVGAVYRAVDIVCFPSRGPELGRPVLEAQAHARPVVASGSATGGGVVDDGRTGMLVPPGSPEAIADAISRLAGDEALRRRLGAAAREHAERHYAPHLVAGKVLEIYRRAAERASLGLDAGRRHARGGHG